MSRFDLLVVGSGPAGMATAIAARRLGLSVAVVDDQPAPGGQIWRSVETISRRDAILGPAYVEGRAVANSFRACGATYMPGFQLWKVDEGLRAWLSCDGQAQGIEAAAIVLATGAQERPAPFPGWTLPGVLTVGAAQIMLKNAGQVPTEPAWIAGSGPLPLLYAVQLLRAGGTIAGYLDTTPAGQWRRSLRYLPKALRAAGDLLKGLGWMAQLRASGTPVFRQVETLEACGGDRLEELRFSARGNAIKTAATGILLVHEGVVPNIHAPLSLDCDIAWNPGQDCFAPVLDEWGESSRAGVYVVGDGAGIAGAKAALLRGEVAALRIATKAGRLSDTSAANLARPVRRKLARELAARPFLDAMFRPRAQVFEPADETIVCRCEELRAGDIRVAATVGQPGPNLVKSATRCGMGPCQGRQCGYSVTRILAEVQDRSPAEVGFFHIRAPLKPVTLGELAALHQPAGS